MALLGHRTVCMHLCIILCIFNIRSIELHTLHLNRVLVLLTTYPPKQGSGTRVRVGGRHLAMSLYKLKASGSVTYFN